MINNQLPNNVLFVNHIPELKRGERFTFSVKRNQPLIQTNSIFLITNDWQAYAEVSIEQQQDGDTLSGLYRVDYIYDYSEQQQITALLKRQYAGIYDPYIYLLSSISELEKAKSVGFLTRDSLQKEGFIHATPKHQLTRLANKYYQQVDSALVLTIEVSKINVSVKWEPATGGLYPHIYGTLNLDSIVEIQPISLNEAGTFVI